ncbi:MAG: hypothetical protein J0L84_12125 [Verrucomicrobia bacterium]|nr:hypothetical protein [Verrucomicrobiota bacterium]
MNRSLQLALAALLLFGAGFVSGGVVSRLGARLSARREEARRGELPPMVWSRTEILRRAQRDLDLTQDQRQRIEGHLKAGQESLRALWAPVAPGAKAEVERLRDRIRSELTPDQQTRFDTALQERLRKGPRSGDRGPSDGSRRGKPEGGRERTGDPKPPADQ